MKSIKALTRPSIWEIKPYSSARDEFEIQDDNLLFLDANENPFNNNLNRYPDPKQFFLKQKLSELKHVKPKQILIGNGSDEVLDLLFRAFCEPFKDSILTLTPTYGMYGVLAHLNAIENQEVSLTSDFQIDVENVLKTIQKNTKIIILCSPNNPSGNLLDSKAIEQIIKVFDGLVIIDEAYIDFTNSRSWLDRLNEFPNLVVIQTLSKAYGLAAIRLGMCFASKNIIEILNKIKPPYNINSLTQDAALSGILKRDEVERQIKIIVTERNKLIIFLKQLYFVENVFPTDSNFILIRVDNANLRYKQLISKNVIVRNRHKQNLCQNCLRITIGTPDDNIKLINALKSI